MQKNVFLVPIDKDAMPGGFTCHLSDVLSQVLHATAELYATVGFEEPWIGYLAHVDEVPVGTCGFKSAPCNGRVEIAYFTFPGFEGHGYATAMAIELVAIARRNMPSVIIAAQTLPNRNASHRVLEKLGFRHIETTEHPEDGMVWEWQLSNEISNEQPACKEE